MKTIPIKKLNKTLRQLLTEYQYESKQIIERITYIFLEDDGAKLAYAQLWNELLSKTKVVETKMRIVIMLSYDEFTGIIDIAVQGKNGERIMDQEFHRPAEITKEEQERLDDIKEFYGQDSETYLKEFLKINERLVRELVKSKEEVVWALDFRDRDEWMNMQIELENMPEEFSELDVLTNILHEISFVNFDESIVMQMKNEIDKRKNELDKWIKEGTLHLHSKTQEEVEQKLRNLFKNKEASDEREQDC